MSKGFKIIGIILGLIILMLLPIFPVKVSSSIEHPCAKEETNSASFLPSMPTCYDSETLFVSPLIHIIKPGYQKYYFDFSK